MSKLLDVMEFMFDKHYGQLDKGGIPYILHPCTVASNCNGDSEKVVAYLHDVLKNTDATVKDLENIGCTQEEVEAIVLLTKNKSQSYMEYIEKLSDNELARHVKLQDLKHNMDLSRLRSVNDEDLKRTEKYQKAYDTLLAVENKKVVDSGNDG